MNDADPVHAARAELARRGAETTVPAHRAAGTPLPGGSADHDLVVVEQSGYRGVTADAAGAHDVRRRLVPDPVP